MRDGFIKVGAAVPQICVADCVHNREEIVKKAKEMSAQGARILVFPELCITGYTCHDLFWQETLLASAKEQLLILAEDLKDTPGLIFVGLPWCSTGNYTIQRQRSMRERSWGSFPKSVCPITVNFMKRASFPQERVLQARFPWEAVRCPLAAGSFLSVKICRGFA